MSEDFSQLKSDFAELNSSTAELNSSTAKLQSGAEELKKGVSEGLEDNLKQIRKILESREGNYHNEQQCQ
ncbi:hypothetical protein MMC20_005553 [Loxospora ochrophaea]|nr:hypothetical protein [Loxospora ochrophaea]